MYAYALLQGIILSSVHLFIVQLEEPNIHTYHISLCPRKLAVLGCTGLWLAVPGCTGLYWAVLGSGGLYWAVLGFTRLNWAVVGCSRLYCGVMGCTGRSQQLFSVY